MSKKGYTDAEKIAYYRAKANSARGGSYTAKGKKDYTYYKQKKKMYQAKTQANQRKDPGIISALGSVGGSIVGGMTPLGTVLGGFLGGKLGHLVENITGFGDYKLNSNSIMRGGMSPPQVVNSQNNGAFIVRHREYIGDVSASSAFTLTSYPLNPGMEQTFPWLSRLAGNFEQYSFRGVLFEFLSTSSDSILATSATSALGTVNMATEYDSLEPNFPDKRAMLNHEFANSRKPSVTFIHPVECKRNRTPVSELYVRQGPVPTGGDQRLYDLGNFQIATEGMQASTGVCGELWVTYECLLLKQKYSEFSAADGLTDHFQLAGVTNSLPLGSASQSAGDGSTLMGSITANIARYTFEPHIRGGKYLINWVVIGSSTASLSNPDLTFVNCEYLEYWTNDTIGAVETPDTTTSAVMFKMATIQITAPGAYISWATNGTLPSSSTSGDLWITQFSQSVVGNTKKALKELVVNNEPSEIEELRQQLAVLTRRLERTNSKSSF